MAARPFALTQVKLTESLFTQKRDRMLAYARGYGGEADVFAGPDRVLSIFRANAGLDTKGAQAVGSWESGTGYLRGHYAGHFMSMLSQAYAGTGDEIFKQKLDYIVRGSGGVPGRAGGVSAAAHARSAGRFGGALRLRGSPIGLAEHVAIPTGVVSGLRDFTIALWINPAQYDRTHLSDARANADQATLYNGTAVFDFGQPNPQFAEPALSRMYLTVRAGNDKPVPRFAITTSGVNGEQRLDAAEPLAVDRWTHVADDAIGVLGDALHRRRAGRDELRHDALARGPRRDDGQLARPLPVSAAQRFVSQRAARRVPDLRSRADAGRCAISNGVRRRHDGRRRQCLVVPLRRD